MTNDDERRALSRRGGGGVADANNSSSSTSYGTINRRIANIDDDDNNDPATDTITVIHQQPSDETTSTSSSPPSLIAIRLRIVEKLGYGLGHVFNDLCAGVWFSYTLLFMQGALGMASAVAGTLVMVGQVGDALATPIIGCLADRYGTKRQWHIGGTLLVLCTFPLIFSWCPWCRPPGPTWYSAWWQPTYFTLVILAFQLGWAIVQITHLAMIPELARSQTDRADLTAIRYSASVCSSVVVYVVMWLVLSEGEGADKRAHITPADAFRFRDVSLILSLIGASMSVCFHFSLAVSGYSTRRRHALDTSNTTVADTTAEHHRQRHRRNSDASVTAPDLLDVKAIGSGNTSANTTTTTETSSLLGDAETNDTAIGSPVPVERKNFFRTPLLYQNAFLYVFSRLFCTTALVYIPLWLDERSWAPASAAAALPTLANRFGPMRGRYGLEPWMLSPNATADDGGGGTGNVAHIAIIPLVSFVASFVASVWMKLAHRLLGPKMAYLIGSVASVGACVWVAWAAPPTATALELCMIAVLFGAGSSVTMISSLCITADMIGKHADQSGFIYSAVTFADKLITGVVVIVIESMKCNKRSDCPEYYRNVLAYACGVSAGLGLLTLATLQCHRRRRLVVTDSSHPYTRV